MSKEKEINATEVVAEVSGVGTYKFIKPTKIDGEEVKEINYDLNVVDGGSIRRVKGGLMKRGYTVAIKELDEVYHAAIFAEATGLTIDNVESFSPVDYMNVADLVKDFLFGEVLTTSQE